MSVQPTPAEALDTADTIVPHNPLPIRAITILLGLQTVGLISMLLYFLNQVDWDTELAAETPSRLASDTTLLLTLFLPISIGLVLVTLVFFLQRRSAWFLTMLLQGSSLFCCLWLYFMTDSFLRDSRWLYIQIASSVILVLYLNTADVRTAFLSKPTPAGPNELAEFLDEEGVVDE
jgi:cellulose synthase/poly-beta-1,6-N-acetylglucosamine synthase-like glycosyltransferase